MSAMVDCNVNAVNLIFFVKISVAFIFVVYLFILLVLTFLVILYYFELILMTHFRVQHGRGDR